MHLHELPPCSSTPKSKDKPPAAAGPNSDPIYQQLRNINLSTEAVTVKDFELKRDAATFHLNGYMCFVAPVNGKVTGAVFVGDGTMVLTPPIPIEKSSLKLLTKSDEFVEQSQRIQGRKPRRAQGLHLQRRSIQATAVKNLLQARQE